ncbi:MAG: diadenylate cyclase CdaA [Clostridia bacterium]|nr:diadenylate cyclase CdaA [Clostridia bacterium]
MNDFLTNITDIIGRLGALFKSYNFVLDTIDILIVAFVIFLLIRFLRESRALYVIKGMILILVTYFFVKLLGMQASSFLFKNVMDNALLILLILFSPDIRHALESVGRSRVSFFRIFGLNQSKSKDQRNKKAMSEICKACVDMASKKIGAIIVLERDTPVADHINASTPIDAEVTKELIGSLFFPNSPLHDGAVVIRDSRIVSAGGILPLTENTDLSSELGTRHRASLGLSEQCDAVVVVVSEERGQISIAHKGFLNRDISEGELYDKLSEYFAPVDLIKNKKIMAGRREKDNE